MRIQQTEQIDQDYRIFGPTFVCPCGSNMFNVQVIFDQETRLPGFYIRDMLCVACGSTLTAPTPVDDGHI